jgi:hypothetical protein
MLTVTYLYVLRFATFSLSSWLFCSTLLINVTRNLSTCHRHRKAIVKRHGLQERSIGRHQSTFVNVFANHYINI